MTKKKNDCFSVMPPGVDWTPVEVALQRLVDGITPNVGTKTFAIEDAFGRILAHDVKALRAHPNYTNSAVDGYSVCDPDASCHKFEIIDGRSAAGHAFEGALSPTQALKTLTGAKIPKGAQAVILEEYAEISGTHLSIPTPIKHGANIREAGEDVQKNAKIMEKGHRVNARDLALLAATGIAELECFAQLKVGLMSTGEELLPAGKKAPRDDSVYDANRPMITSILRDWGYEVMDFGICGDDPLRIQEFFENAAEKCDAILISGGASGGDEDHVSRVLRAEADMQTWRVALKPGRPLALANWQGVPVFGLPGNTIAAFVCTIIFARPALQSLAGAKVSFPRGYLLEADFEKKKQPGRTEYLRAWCDENGRVKVQASEGSGRTSGLSASAGLVELPHEAGPIQRGARVKFIPYSEFGVA